MGTKRRFIKVTKCNHPDKWFARYIGDVFEIKKIYDPFHYELTSEAAHSVKQGSVLYIPKTDCVLCDENGTVIPVPHIETFLMKKGFHENYNIYNKRNEPIELGNFLADYEKSKWFRFPANKPFLSKDEKLKELKMSDIVLIYSKKYGQLKAQYRYGSNDWYICEDIGELIVEITVTHFQYCPDNP